MGNEKIIDALYLCAAQCTRCYDNCNMEKENAHLQNCMMADQDCADICRLAGEVLERHSENADLFLKLCVEMCEICAVECEKHPEVEHCKVCAEACRKCAEKCLVAAG